MEELMKKYYVIILMLLLVFNAYAEKPSPLSSGMTLHLSFDTKKDILSDFLSSSFLYRVAKPGAILQNPLKRRKLEIVEGKYGKALHIKHGWSVTKGTSNESGADLDLIVATIWGDWRTKPHYWGQGRFHGNRGTVSFWIKTSELVSDPLYPIFTQTSIAWGRKERDLFRVDGHEDGSLSASIRDIFYQHHKVKSKKPVWTNGKWQHIAVVYDQAYGLKLYHNGTCIASNWGNDAWWQTPMPGLFSPFHPEAYFDEIYFFDRPLNEKEINSLYSTNTVPQNQEYNFEKDDAARRRVLNSYGDIDNLNLPVLNANEESLLLHQTKIKNCHDEKIPAWWVMDGRYELAWPHPYRLFTFILGDVDFHGEKVNIDLQDGETANYISMEGILDGIEVIPGKPGQYENEKIIDLNGYSHFFFSDDIDLNGNTSLHFPMVKGYGTPPGLVDRESLNFPLSGNIRLHEVQLWDVKNQDLDNPQASSDLVWHFPYKKNLKKFDLRYLDGLLKLIGTKNRTLFIGSSSSKSSDNPHISLEPLQSVHFFSPDLNPDIAVDKIRLRFSVIPEKSTDVMWIKLRDPANPYRIWAKTVIRLNFDQTQKPQRVDVEMDPIDIMLASEDRLWVELKFANKEKIITQNDLMPQFKVVLSSNREKSLDEYAKHEMLPARMQYMKEYNYQPWLFTGEQRSKSNLTSVGGTISTNISFVSGQIQGLKFWTKFGGPYDMWYPPEAVLRHEPNHETASIYKAITGERAQTYGGYNIRSFSREERVKLCPDIPHKAPSWAVWEREMYKKQLRTIRWIVDMQRDDGMFWGGCNDDVFIPLGYSGIPFMGDDTTRKAFLKLYNGLEKRGVYKNGYCDIWPIDYLHITDYLASRGLMVPYALGDPHVLEREMITAKVYKDIMEKNNVQRAKKGLPPYKRSQDSHRKEPKLWGESLVRDYETTQVLWYWDETSPPEPHRITDSSDIARKMMSIAIHYDRIEEFEWTRAMRHTDRQAGAPGRNELITAALGGRLQGRIEPHPHSMVVSWDNPDPDIARLVSYGDEKSLKVNLYNFKTEPQKIAMQLWRIQRGLYSLKVGKDNNNDMMIDSPDSVLREEEIELKRFSKIRLNVPAQQNITVHVDLLNDLENREKGPDLAINSKRDIKQQGDSLYVTVHNIGNAEAKDVRVEVLDRSGSVIEIYTVPELAAPLDFVPKKVDVIFHLKGKKWKKVTVDPLNSIQELYEGNNEITRLN